MKKIIAVLIAAAIAAMTLAACGAENKGGSASVKKAQQSEEIVTELPEKIDLRNYNGKNYVTPVKDQYFGDCWAFSLAGAAEISYLFANDLGVPAGEVNNKADFSEKYIVWFMYHGITKDDVLTGRVRASQTGEGFDPSETEKSAEKGLFEKSVYSIGGEFVHDANLFGSGFGPVDESESVNGETPFKYAPSSGDDWSIPLKSEYRCAHAKAIVKTSRILPAPAASDENGEYKFNEEGINAIKSELSKGHGVSAAMFATDIDYNYENRAVYYDGEIASNHGVVLVGYDDSFPKEDFNKKDNGTIPPKDGAFIVKNSWGSLGEDEKDTDDGYLYVSYYDHGLTSPLSYEFNRNDSAVSANPNFDQYDLMMTSWYGSTDYDSETKMANVFDAEEDESLCQISYRTSFPNTEVTYEVYRGVEGDNPSSGALLEKGVNSHVFSGVYTIDLNDKYPLKKGDRYSVVLTVKRVPDKGKNAVYTEIFPYSTNFSFGLTVRGVINKGESYLYTGGKWSDMTNMKESLIERAYKQCSEALGTKETSVEVDLESKDNFTIDNYPIKAISVPSD